MNAPTGRSVPATVARARQRTMVYYGRHGVVSLNSLAVKFGKHRAAIAYRYRKLNRPRRVYSWLFTASKEQFELILKKFEEDPKAFYFNHKSSIEISKGKVEKYTGEKTKVCNYGKIDKALEEYVIKKIEIPISPSSEFMMSFRKLAARVIVEAAGDMQPMKLDKGVSKETAIIAETRRKDEAERWLLGESSPKDLELWCSLAGLPKELIAREITNNRKQFLERLQELFKQRKRGRPKKD